MSAGILAAVLTHSKPRGLLGDALHYRNFT